MLIAFDLHNQTNSSLFFTIEKLLQVWHAVSADKKLLRKHYLEMIVPPFATLLRRWRPLLSGMHELTDADGQSPLAVEDRSLAIDAHPLEVAIM